MDLSRIIKERRSIHAFRDEPVPLELVRELLDLAVWAPNHNLSQPWRFVVVHGEGRRRMAEAARSVNERRERDPERAKELGQQAYERVMAVPLFLIVIMREDSQLTVREEDYAATCCVIQNFSLLAWERGYGTLWETYGFIHRPAFRLALGVRPGEKIVGSLHVGRPAAIPPARSRVPGSELMTVIDEP